MNQQRKFFSGALSGIFLFLFISFSNFSFALDGQAIYKTYCATCHKPDADFTGPALKGARQREPSKDWVYKWVGHVDEMLATDPYAKQLFAKFNSKMTAFPDLKKEEIDAVLDWADSYQKPAAPGAPVGQAAPVEDNSLLYGLLTLVLGVIGLILLQVNSNLKKLSDEKQGLRTAHPVPFYRNKAYLLIGVIVLFLIGGYYTISGAIGLGRSKGYQPIQPIYYSHKVHAGTNKISCLYCHGGSQDSKHANIPSVNVCMNCHMAINEYGGEQLYTAEGKEVN